MDEKKEQELIDTFKRDGVKACMKKIDKKNEEEVSFCEKLWINGLVTEYIR